jgi:predicted HTH domain antitoxin
MGWEREQERELELLILLFSAGQTYLGLLFKLLQVWLNQLVLMLQLA